MQSLSSSTEKASLVRIEPENPLERRITADAEWKRGSAWGRPRRGHPEGAVIAHIVEVLNNIDRMDVDGAVREDLRLIALVHDSFKIDVDTTRPRTGDNHHAMKARRFAERFIERADLLDIIELHDEAYNAWRGLKRDEGKAVARLYRLFQRLGESLELYLLFFEADNRTGDKGPESFEWAVEMADSMIGLKHMARIADS